MSSILPRSILYNPTLRVHVGARNHHEDGPIGSRVALAPSQVRQAPELNVIHFIVVTDAMSRICILMHDGAPSDA